MKFRNIKSNNEIIFDPTTRFGLEEAVTEFKKFITDLTEDEMIRFLLG
jgi:hypothetical protein